MTSYDIIRPLGSERFHVGENRKQKHQAENMKYVRVPHRSVTNGLSIEAASHPAFCRAFEQGRRVPGRDKSRDIKAISQ